MGNDQGIIMEVHQDYIIHTKAGMEKGIFFRNPIQKVLFDSYSDNPLFSAWNYLTKTNSIVFRVLQSLLGNNEILKTIGIDSKDFDWGGFRANIICFPIYFKRNARALNATARNIDSVIQEISSHGYESEFENCAGACAVEKTIFITKTGYSFRETNYGSYQYTYPSKIHELNTATLITNIKGERMFVNGY